MKWLLKAMERFRPYFEEGGRLAPLHPVYEAAEKFFFAPLAPAQAAPHVRDPLDVKRYMSTVIVAALPCVLAALYFFGLRVLAMIVVSYAAGGIVETAIAIKRKEDINEGFLVTGLLFPLTLPPALPLWMVAVGVIFGVLVGKELFGGTGRNLFNPALVGRTFLAVAYPAAMTANWVVPGSGWSGRLGQYVSRTSDAVTEATPLMEAGRGVFAGLSELLIGNVSGSVAETSALALIAGGIFLMAIGVANWRVVVGLLGSFLALNALLHGLQPEIFGPPGWHLLAGGLLFGTFFMATDPVTSPMTNNGKWMFGILIGTCTVLIRNLTGFVEGVMFAILLGNIAAPLLDEIALKLHVRELNNEG